MFPHLVALAAIGLAGPAWADNPFATAGAFGVGQGWRSFPGKAAGAAVRREGTTLRIDDTELDTTSACTDQFIPVSGRVAVTGRWKYDGVQVDAGWKGARLVVYYYDAQNQKLKGDANQPVLGMGSGSADWTAIDRTLVVPEAAVKARLCGELVYTSAGSMWLDSMQLVDLAPGAADAGKNVLWILVDTLRGDHLGTYGGNPKASPHLDALAAESLVYDTAWTQYTWTVPSTIAFMTSQFARTHGWNSTFEKVAAGDYTEMGAEVPTVAEVLRAQGYITSAHYANGLLKSGIGLGRGFQEYRFGSDEEVVRRSLRDLAQWDADGAPNFLYVHLMTPHIPLRPSAEAQAALGYTLSPPEGGFRYYEGEVTQAMTAEQYHQVFQQAYTAAVFDADRYVDQVLDALAAGGHAEDTIVIVTSDHGELLGEHGAMGHGSYVYEGLTAVPLIVRAPGRAPARVTNRVGRTIDIAPTILDWLDLERAQPRGWQGISLFTSKPGLVAVSERDYQVAFTTDGRWKTIENRDTTALLSAFDLQTDPGELQSVADSAGKPVSDLVKQAATWRATTPIPGQEILQTRRVVPKSDKEKEEELEMLRALGYVE